MGKLFAASAGKRHSVWKVMIRPGEAARQAVEGLK